MSKIKSLLKYESASWWQPLGKADLVNLARVRPLVANLYLSVRECPLVAHLGIMAWECPLLAKFCSLAWELPLFAISGRLVRVHP